MKRKPLKKALLEYINSKEGWIPKVDLYIVGDSLEFSPETVGRCLRTLAEENEIQVDYYDGRWAKNLARYSKVGHKDTKPVYEMVTRDGVRVMIQTT